MSVQTGPVCIGDVVIERRRISVRGVVQGVGFRPFVARLAAELRLSGHCGNDDSRVFVEVEGPAAAVAEFTRRVRFDAPPMSMIVDLRTEVIPTESDRDFRIVDSRQVADDRTLVPADVAICDDCLAELRDPADRRYRHPFINCTNCGPRLTVIVDLPYDRPVTTMAPFEMCARCRDEYSRPTDRRYHAQPISCHECGPRLSLETADAAVVGDDDVITKVQQAFRDGLIVAVKGIGGFHLACDATNPRAVRRLRERKRRPHKPFAVMVPNIAAAQEICAISDPQADVLQQRSRPIVLLAARAGSPIAADVAPGLDELGVMLPYAPLHHLLFAPVPGSDEKPPALLVMTSGNTSGAPLVYDNADARSRLAGIADVFLMHDRTIAVPCEDSVLGVVDGTEMPIRRSRGYAPLPVLLQSPGPVVLAVGAEVKNTFCLTRQDYAFCSAHLGDMGTLESRSAFERSVRQLTTLHRAEPEIVVADDHPGYSTRQWAQRYCDAHDLELRTVQHHHAHVASLMAEHDRLGTRLLGIAFDGTGYGCDRTVWGGEMLSVGPDPLTAERAGHLRPFLLPGGDAAVRNPARVALALLAAAGVDDHDLPCTQALSADEYALVKSQLRSGTACVRTSSVGRLFDGVASLLGVRHRVTYEAQAAIELEACARSAAQVAELTVGVDGDQLDFAPLLRELVVAVRDGEPVERLALGFHHALALATATLAERSARERGIDTIGLTGGVFGNRILTTSLQKILRDNGFEVLTHRLVPANDGGLSLGQAVLGRALAARDSAAGRERIGVHP
ncbi:carbamoyltransferase HypF [Gordonia sp. TBRC 11910]|uniref:Carbamoyltransferase n=1 Tax=Gordonia asplenii TaxID=2725283 RepID=A0A848L5C0_9ACTN|nr:carbamoyltransferase HypF [Gordonia asplenii]NMO02818.1 carbamoyltransferase HypF [Gordonia asplenii]